MFTIRSASADDAESLVPLLTQLGYPSDATSIRKRIEPLIRDANHQSLVAESGGAVVGFIGARLDRSFEYDGLQARILALVVDESHRGGGMGRAMIEAIAIWARELDAHKIIVNTSHRRTATHEFYRRAGFESTGLRFVKVF